MNSKRAKTCVRLQLDEPWDFQIPGKGNVIEGRLEEVCHGPAEKNWQGEYLLVSLTEEFVWKGETVKQLLLSPRYEGDAIKDILDGKTVIVGIARVKPSTTLKGLGTFTPQQVDYFAIGSAQLIFEN